MQIRVPLFRPYAVLRPYAGRHRAPEVTPEPGFPEFVPAVPRPVGEGTRDRRPNSLRDWEGETRRLTPTQVESARIRAAAGVL